MAETSVYSCLLRSLANARALQRVHSHLLRSGRLPRDTFLANLLVQMYGRCGELQRARAIFDCILARDTFSWNLMISAYAHGGAHREALALFASMPRTLPDGFTVATALSSSAALLDLAVGEIIRKCALACDLLPSDDPALNTALLNMYAKCGRLDRARATFDSMRSRDAVSWNAMITALAQYGQCDDALALFQEMGSTGGIKPTAVTFLALANACASSQCLHQAQTIHHLAFASGFRSHLPLRNALITMYGACGNLKDAHDIFDTTHPRDVITWNAMLAACVQNACSSNAIELFERMATTKVKPSKVTFLALFGACSSPSLLEYGRAVHKSLVFQTHHKFLSDVDVNTAALTMYSKCGSVEEARSVFDGMCRRHQLDTVSWSAMIEAYARNGQDKDALTLFGQMCREGVKPDCVTFRSVLNSCSALACLEKGEEIHECMLASGVKLDAATETALLDMYSKCGSLKMARAIFDGMHTRDVISWNAMLVGYAQIGHAKEVLELFRLMDLSPDKVTFLCLLHACSHSGMWEEGLQYFGCMRDHHDITPSQEHFVCMLDLLARVGRLNEAEELARNMPIQTDAIVCMILLSSRGIHDDDDDDDAFWGAGRAHAREEDFQLNPKNDK